MTSLLKSLPKLPNARANDTPQVIVIVGPTASGKTSLAISLAKKLHGEIISADSRQVYRGMDIGSGKDLKEYGKVPYHLIDIVSPKTNFTLAQWQKAAYKAIDDIVARGKVAIVCGGTGLYIQALVEGYTLPSVTLSSSKGDKTNAMLRQAQHDIRVKLQKLTLAQLLARLRKVDPKTYKIIDRNNRRRIERAVEIYYQTGKPKSQQIKPQKPPYEFILIGVKRSPETLRERINQRLDQRLKQGMVAEVKRLHDQGVSWKRLESFGLEYRFVAYFLQKKITRIEMREQLQKAIWQFSRRQMTWFRGMNVEWIEVK